MKCVFEGFGLWPKRTGKELLNSKPSFRFFFTLYTLALKPGKELIISLSKQNSKPCFHFSFRTLAKQNSKPCFHFYFRFRTLALREWTYLINSKASLSVFSDTQQSLWAPKSLIFIMIFKATPSLCYNPSPRRSRSRSQYRSSLSLIVLWFTWLLLLELTKFFHSKQ